jgi:hypothetical protein
MRADIARLLRAAARGLLELADRLESAAPPAVLEPEDPADLAGAVGPETAAARRFADEIALRDLLRRALRRYSPREPTYLA